MITGFILTSVLFYLLIFGIYMADATAEVRTLSAPRWWFAAAALVMLFMAGWGMSLLWRTLT